MSDPDIQATPYGSIPVSPTPEDVSNVWTWSLDMRRETGGPAFAMLPDESTWVQPGVLTRAVFPTCPGHAPVGEVRIILNGKEARLVGARTDREFPDPDTVEVTAEEVRAMRKNPQYAAQMRAWLAE